MGTIISSKGHSLSFTLTIGHAWKNIGIFDHPLYLFKVMGCTWWVLDSSRSILHTHTQPWIQKAMVAEICGEVRVAM